MFPHFQKYLNPQVRSKTVFFLPPLPLSFKISLRDTSFYISLNSLGFYLSRILVEFSLTCIFQHVREKMFNFWCPHSKKIIESMLFYSCHSPALKTLGRIFWKSVSPKTEGVKEAIICSAKIQSENIKLTGNISLFPFGMIANFLKVIALQLCK